MTFRNGLDSLLRPEDSVLVLIDHQPYQLANLNSHEPQMVVNNTAALAKAAKAFGVPTILVCNSHVMVSYHHMKRSELVSILNVENLVRQLKPSASPFTPALTLNGCQER